MRSFVLAASEAIASDEFSLESLPGTSGRLDVALRCVRAALLVSHGLRRDVAVYLALGGGRRAPRVLRVQGARVRFLRPDERSLAVLAKKVLASHDDDSTDEFVEVRPGVAVARGGIARAIADIGDAALFVLDAGGSDLRACDGLERASAAFFLGDHRGFAADARADLEARGARAVGLGPVHVHAEDAIAIVSNEIDRRERRAT